MIAGLHIGSNFRKFGHGKLPPLAIIAITLIPLLFGGLFVWSYYDPLGNLHKMPVALVNSDEGEHGLTVVEELMDEQPMDFRLVSAEEAQKGVADGTYYLGVEIPSDFSEAAESVKSDNPHQAKLNISLNETNGFIPTMLGNQVTLIMSSVISESVSKEVVNQLFVGFNTIHEGMEKAADGADQLDDGANKAKDGSGKLKDGAGKLNGGVGELDNGIKKLADGAQQLDSGIGELQQGANTLNEKLGEASQGANKLADGLSALQDGTAQLGAGAAAIAGGVGKLTSITDQLNVAQNTFNSINATLDQAIRQLDATPVPGASDLANQARGLKAQLNADQFVAMNPQMINDLTKLRNGTQELSTQLNDPTAKYRAGVEQAVSGAQTLAQGLQMLHDGSGTLVVGVGKLKDGSSRLVVGANSAAEGTSKLAGGSNQLVVGLNDLNDGLVTLSDGTGELSLKLNEGADKAPTWEGDRLEKATEAAGNPVVHNNTGDELTFFGKGLSPFFLSLSLWIGGLVLYMILAPFSRRVIDSGTNPFRMVAHTLLPSLIVGFVQAVLLWLVQVVAIGVEPKHPLGLFGVLWFGSWVFMSLILAINMVFGPATGRLVTMALMSLQLVASNGLYPPEVQPGFIQWVHAWDPMRFTVDMIRVAFFGTHAEDPRLLRAIVVLTLLAVAAWFISAWGMWKRRILNDKDIHPELAL